MQPVLAVLRHLWLTAPGDLGAATRRANGGLLVLVPDQRPAECFAPEVADLLGTDTGDRTDESALSEELVTCLDHAELIAFRIGEHHVALVGSLTDVDVSRAESKRPLHCLPLGLEIARQIEVHIV